MSNIESEASLDLVLGAKKEDDGDDSGTKEKTKHEASRFEVSSHRLVDFGGFY